MNNDNERMNAAAEFQKPARVMAPFEESLAGTSDSVAPPSKKRLFSRSVLSGLLLLGSHSALECGGAVVPV